MSKGPWMSKTDLGGRLGPVTQTIQPARIEGADQRGGAVLPEACMNCHATPPMWETNWYKGHCRACGADWYRTAYHVVESTRGIPRLARTRKRRGRRRSP